jgi:serine/threonine protein phosphatase PrpC
MDRQTGTAFSEDALLKQFKKGDFERAKASLLERFHEWNDILISVNEQSVITPDDIEHFRVQAADLLEQAVKSDYEWEQLKILTVLIYQLMSADKTALPVDSPAIHKQLEELNPPHASQYIIRRIVHGADQLNYVDIERFVRYQNLVLSSYITSIPPESSEGVTTIEGLVSQDGVYFDLLDTPHDVQLRQRSDQAKPVEAPPQEPGESEIEPDLTEELLETIVIANNDAQFLVNTMQRTSMHNDIEVTGASYVGKDRKNNEDAVVFIPDKNQVVVIDAMGGYGNGVDARDVFVDMVLKHQGEIQQAVYATQKGYDNIGLEQGGVCLINTDIRWKDDSFRITLSQAGDVHAILFDENGEIKYETVDESIGHQVVNAVIGAAATELQRVNGWSNFGHLTQATLRAKPGWRFTAYSDGIANHFNAEKIKELIFNKTSQQAIAAISQAVDTAMSEKNSYKDNCSIAIIDF